MTMAKIASHSVAPNRDDPRSTRVRVPIDFTVGKKDVPELPPDRGDTKAPLAADAAYAFPSPWQDTTLNDPRRKVIKRELLPTRWRGSLFLSCKFANYLAALVEELQH
jgi:hypothetical protein